MKKFVFLTLAVILAIGLMLGSCGEQEEPEPAPAPAPAPAPSPEPTPSPEPGPAPAPGVECPVGVPGPQPGGIYGGRLKLVGSGNVGNMGNPNEISNPGDAGYAYPALEGLITRDESGNFLPWLAKDWDIAEDGKSITFYLQECVDFHDGVHFDAEAAKVNIDIQISTPAWQNLKMVTKCEVIDEYTVKLYLDQWDWTMMNSLSFFFSCMMFSPDALQNQSAEWLRSHPVGTGPFVLSEYNRDMYIKYDRNENYWRGRPYLYGVDFIFIPDPTTQLLAFKSGEVDMAGIAAQDVEDIKAEGFEMTSTKGWIVGLYPNSTDPNSPLADIRVRRAIDHAIDKQELADGLGYGYSRPCDQVFLRESGGWSPDVVGYPFDLDEAKRLLTEAGYPDGFPAKLLMVEFMELDAPIAIQDMLKKNINVEIEFDRVSMAQLSFQIATPPGWDQGWAFGASPEATGSDPGNVLINGTLNNNTTWVGMWQPPELLELAKAAASETDQEKRMAMYRELSKKQIDEYAQCTNLYDLTFFSAVSPRIKGHTVGQFGAGTFAFTFAWIEE